MTTWMAVHRGHASKVEQLAVNGDRVDGQRGCLAHAVHQGIGAAGEAKRRPVLRAGVAEDLAIVRERGRKARMMLWHGRV
jgi:hypothetical protein